MSAKVLKAATFKSHGHNLDVVRDGKRITLNGAVTYEYETVAAAKRAMEQARISGNLNAPTQGG